VSAPSEDPTPVSEETLRIFETRMNEERRSAEPDRRPGTRQGALILLGIGGCIVAGSAYALVTHL
jgi:hypothetical protein